MSIAISRCIHMKLVIQNLMALVTSLAIAFTAVASGAYAETALPIEHRLSLEIALNMANTAITACRSQGISVSASVVDQHGKSIVQLQGDHAPPHTYGLSQKKAYTAVALAPIQGLKRTSEVAAALRASHLDIGKLALPADTISNITPIAGGAIIELGNEVIGAIGVSGARSGIVDESCAEAGLLKITQRETQT
jgi:uncharacterized protein GlcG (DUF336 family)